jgi:hypothetical protein
VLEEHALARQTVERRCFAAAIAVGAEPVGADRVEGYEK